MPFHSVITSLSQSARHTHIQFPNVIVVDQIKADISQQSNTRPALTKTESDQLCYVIYTSGSTGKPKGVEITHRNICHYVSVASDLYKMTPHDKVYQGFSLAFDASLEELWMTFANGGTLIACTSKDIRSGVGLTDFLNDHKVTVFSTVPTLLSTLEDDFPELRLLILGGEACSDQLINRWSRTGLRIINTYGPTEATVIATYAECHAHQPVTIGKPLPGYDVLILDEHLQPVPNGQQGELCIAGLGLARGYVNQPEITAQKFIKHFISLGVDAFIIADIMLYNLEIAQALSAEKQINNIAFYKSMLISFEQAISFMIDKGILEDFKNRVVLIKENAKHQNWSNGYEFNAIVERFDY